VTRLPRLTRDQLDPGQQRLFDQIAGGEKPGQRPRFPRLGTDGALEGPFNAMLYSARIGLAMQDLGSELRYRSTLPDRCREIAILATAAAWDSAYERYAHEDIGRAVGLTDAELTAIAQGAEPGFTNPAEQAVLAAARALAQRQDLDDAEYAAAVSVLGERTLFELIALVGYYAATALALRAFRVRPPHADGSPSIP